MLWMAYDFAKRRFHLANLNSWGEGSRILIQREAVQNIMRVLGRFSHGVKSKDLQNAPIYSSQTFRGETHRFAKDPLTLRIHRAGLSSTPILVENIYTVYGITRIFILVFCVFPFPFSLCVCHFNKWQLGTNSMVLTADSYARRDVEDDNISTGLHD